MVEATISLPTGKYSSFAELAEMAVPPHPAPKDALEVAKAYGRVRGWLAGRLPNKESLALRAKRIGFRELLANPYAEFAAAEVAKTKALAAPSQEAEVPDSEKQRVFRLQIYVPGQGTKVISFKRGELKASDARWHTLAFGQYEGLTLHEIANNVVLDRGAKPVAVAQPTAADRFAQEYAHLFGGQRAVRPIQPATEDDFASDKADEGIKYLSWLSNQDWIADYTIAALEAYLSHPIINQRLERALAIKDRDGEPIMHTIGLIDEYAVISSDFEPSSSFDTSVSRWLGYRPGGRWVTRIAESRKHDIDPTPSHMATVGNIADRLDGADDNEEDSATLGDDTDDGWVDYQVFEEDEAWATVGPKARPTIRTKEDAWRIAGALATKAEAITPWDAPLNEHDLRQAIANYNSLREEVAFSLTESGTYFKIVDHGCRNLLRKTVLSAKGRIASRAKALGFRLNTINGALNIFTPAKSSRFTIEDDGYTAITVTDNGITQWASWGGSGAKVIHARDCEPEQHLVQLPAQPQKLEVESFELPARDLLRVGQVLLGLMGPSLKLDSYMSIHADMA